jgi:hypothetical protein
MNERIQKLYQQSHITTTQQLRKGGWDNDREPFEYHTVTQTAFSPEKFAELIIKECASICEINGNTYMYSFTPAKARLAESASKYCGMMIKKHFGVENE